MSADAVALTRSLLQFETINPPGRERECAQRAGAMLEEWGYRVEYHEYAEGRTSVVARAGGSDSKAPLVLTGHLDVVPLGTRKWLHDAFPARPTATSCMAADRRT
jgi:succinyl-diaminopimelate desuccinylase